MNYLQEVGIVAGVILVWGIYTYNRFVSAGRHVNEAWSGVSVQMKRRHDLIPNLVETVKGYARHEQGLFEDIARLRAGVAEDGAPSRETVRGESALGGVLGRLMAVAEAYPELKASENFVSLQGALAEVEEQMQLARRYYNGTVRSYVILLESFPSLIVGKLGGFKPFPFFELENDAEKAVPTVGF